MKHGMLQVYHSAYTDIYENLALEKWWMDHRPEGVCVLMFYVNELSVVIGRHQNPWRETDPARVKAAGGVVARRISGGGAVVHDAGNLNVSFIMARAEYRRAEIFEVMIAALADCGVSAEVDARNSLMTSGGKVSGNAFAYRRDSVLHHGTFLISSDLERLSSLLQPALPDMETRAVESVRSPVVNLTELKPGFRRAMLEEALVRHWARRAGLSPVVQLDEPPCTGASMAEAVRSGAGADWVYGTTPDFRFTTEGPWGPCRVTVHRGRIEHIDPEGDQPHADYRALLASLVGQPLDPLNIWTLPGPTA